MMLSTVATFLLCLCCLLKRSHGADGRLDGRYSFSLTTFDPNGKLNQVERASRAALLGTPVVAMCCPDNSIILAAPQALSSSPVLMQDDGTARFVQISSDLVMSHTGVAADGRVAIAAAQRLAVEYEFTFDEAMPVEEFLEELSLLFQEYTMKAGARPFGCSLLVGSLSSETTGLYRVDPSGAVETLGAYAVMGSLACRIQSQVEQLSKDSDDATANALSLSLTKLLCDAMDEEYKQPDNNEEAPSKPKILAATFTRGKLSVERRDS
jgi:20S proteasome alpha/beta subunit